jgi:hypothetical protein
MSKSSVAGDQLRARRVVQPAVPLSFSAVKDEHSGAVVPVGWRYPQP